MNSYSCLPTLLLNEIFGYLSVKERIKCKSVCRNWKEEVILREMHRDTLVLHLGPYPWNIRWSQTNSGGLMNFQNSFQMKNLKFLKHPRTRSLLKKTKKLAIVNFNSGFIVDPAMLTLNIDHYISYFNKCEEIEIRNFAVKETLTFDLSKLRSLVIKDSPVDKLVLNCPSLEVLFWGSKVNEIDFRNVKKLKRLICFGWPEIVLMDGRFDCLEYLNLYIVFYELVSERLLDLMPKLKRLVLYSSKLQRNLRSLRSQQQRCGLENLEILCFGFSEPVKLFLCTSTGSLVIDRRAKNLFENYAKLVENSPWNVHIDYAELFKQFKILPGNFFERFGEPSVLEISAVTSYTHLFQFLRCYPFIRQLKIHFIKVKARLILDLMHLLQPSLKELAIVGKQCSDILDIDLSFIRQFDLVHLQLESDLLPAVMISRLAAKRGKYLTFFEFTSNEAAFWPGHKIVIYFKSPGLILFDSCDEEDDDGPKEHQFSSVEHLIEGTQNDPHLCRFICTCNYPGFRGGGILSELLQQFHL